MLALASVLLTAVPAAAHHVSGFVYCDADQTGTFSAGDTPMNAIHMKATSTGPLQVGAEFDAYTPYNNTAGRFYMDLITGTNNYTLQVYGGLPQNATFLIPANGQVPISVVTGDASSEAQVVNFLLGNCAKAPLCNADSCNDNNPCTDDTCIPEKGCEHHANTKACDDGNACTTNDVCQNGACYGPRVDCDDNSACTDDTCDAQLGCVHTPSTKVGSCDDKNPCTDDSCGPKGCIHTNNTASCDDKNACTTGDQCTNGQCSGKPKVCADDNVCTTDSCDPVKGCVNTPNANPCNDNNTCTINDLCKNGQCVGTSSDCDDHNPCTDDLCGPKGCLHTNNTAPCNDGNLCTTNDVCGGGSCSGTPKSCDDGNFCNGTEACNPRDGSCVNTPGGPPFLFCSDARFNNESTIAGDVTVNDPNGMMHFARSAFMPDGTTATANEIELANNASICTAHANIIDKNASAQIRCGTGPAVLPVVVPCCTIPPATCGNQAISLGTGAVGAPLAPGAYGALTMMKNSSLTLQPGTYTFCSIDMGPGAQLITNGATTINDTSDLGVADSAFLGPDSGQPLPLVNVGGTLVKLGEMAVVRALIAAPNAEVRMARAASIEGTLCSNTIGTDKNINLTCVPQTVRPAKNAKARHRHKRKRIHAAAAN